MFLQHPRYTSHSLPHRRGKALYSLRCLWLFTLLAMLLIATAGQAAAADMVVTSLADSQADDGACTLREAITNANADSQAGSLDCTAGSGADRITFSVPGTIALSAALPPITSDITIDGGSTITVSGNHAVQVFFVDLGATLTLQHVEVSNGSSISGGGIYLNGGTLTLTNSTVSDNSAGTGGGIYLNGGTLTLTNSTVSGNSAGTGGGIHLSRGTLTLTNSTVSDNSASSSGGGISLSSGTLTLTNSTVSDNSAGTQGGGGITNNSGTLTLTNSTVSGNSASSFGGGISNASTLTLTNSTVSDNIASTQGGGGISNSGTLTLTNSTVSGNSARSFGGGGGISNSGTLTLTNSTVSGNSAGTVGGGIFNISTLTLTNSIIANNPTGGNCFSNGPAIIDGGNNLDSDASCGLGATSLSNTDPVLDPAGLQDNGGPTRTIALCTAMGIPTGCTGRSPAIDVGNSDLALDSDGAPLLTDQRGAPFSRVDGAQVDIGAYEAQGCGNGIVSSHEVCDDGNTLNGDSCSSTCTLHCGTGFVTSSDGTTCVDVNECALNNGGCGSGFSCTNTPGSFSCNDIDECATNNGGCSVGTICTNTPGSFTCTPIVTTIPMTNLSATLDLKRGTTPTTGSLAYKVTFTLGAGNNGIAPLSELVTVQIGSLTFTIPAGAFKVNKQGKFTFTGKLSGMTVEATITLVSSGRYQLTLEATPLNVSGITNPVATQVRIGNDSGSVSVRATIR